MGHDRRLIDVAGVFRHIEQPLLSPKGRKIDFGADAGNNVVVALVPPNRHEVGLKGH
jgi:hypothetical protein